MRKQAEAALRDSEERLRILFNGINDAVFMHEGSENGNPGRFIEVNDPARERLGYSRSELLTMRPTDIDAPETVPNVSQMMERLYANGYTLWEGIHVCKDGTRIFVEIGNHLAHLEGRQVIISTVRDISERKRAEDEKEKLRAQLLQAQKMEAVGRLAGGVAHDFNNMLQSILGYAEMTLDEVGTQSRLRKNLLEIQNAARRSADLATVYGIVRQNNGFINVISEPGQGARFEIYLPRFETTPDQPATNSESKALPAGTETVLLVEDRE